MVFDNFKVDGLLVDFLKESKELKTYMSMNIQFMI